MKEDRTNYVKLRRTPKYCPKCDPDGLSPITDRLCLEGCDVCAVSTLCVLTPYTGKIVDNGQYIGSRNRWLCPVAQTTGGWEQVF